MLQLPLAAKLTPMAVALALVITSGCQSPSASPQSLPPAGSNQLVVGMAPASVQRVLGDPHKVSPATATNRMEETWIYEIEHPPLYRTIVAEMKSVPWVDPISGEMKSTQEPITNQQRIDRREFIELTFRHGQLIEIKRDLKEQRSFSP